MKKRTEQQLAFLWHSIEFLVIVLLALSVIGWGWSWHHLKPKLVATKPT